MSSLREVFRRPWYLILAASVAACLFALYSILDLRAEGENSGLLAFGNFMTPEMMIGAWGGVYYSAAIIMNILIASLLGLTISLSVLRHHSRSAKSGAACSTVSSVFIGLSAFT